jgi:hypothetical protein
LIPVAASTAASCAAHVAAPANRHVVFESPAVSAPDATGEAAGALGAGATVVVVVVGAGATRFGGGFGSVVVVVGATVVVGAGATVVVVVVAGASVVAGAGATVVVVTGTTTTAFLAATRFFFFFVTCLEWGFFACVAEVAACMTLLPEVAVAPIGTRTVIANTKAIEHQRTPGDHGRLNFARTFIEDSDRRCCAPTP